MSEELDKRKKKLLQTIIEEYIETAEPVSSGNLVKQLECSSATIRNENTPFTSIRYNLSTKRTVRTGRCKSSGNILHEKTGITMCINTSSIQKFLQVRL